MGGVPTLYRRKYAEFYVDVARSKAGGVSVVHKFGRNDSVGTSYAPVAMGAVYNTPQAGSATAMRVKAGNTNDTAAGNGAREVTIEGLDQTGAYQTEALATNGTSAGTAGSTTFMRLYRAYVSSSGTYATSAAGSHSGDIVIENGTGGTDWLTIDSGGGTSFPRGQSEIAVYSVPLNKTAYVTSVHISVTSNKTADILFFQRQDILQTSAPYSAMRVQLEFGGVEGEEIFQPEVPLGPYPALTDVGFMAKAATSAEVDIDFEILLFDS